MKLNMNFKFQNCEPNKHFACFWLKERLTKVENSSCTLSLSTKEYDEILHYRYEETYRCWLV